MKKTLLALALIGASASASADSWIYGSASVGQATLNGESSTSYNIHVGTGILPFIGLEAGLQNYGDFDNVRYDGAVRDLKGTSYYVAAKPSLDFGPLHVYAKAGLHAYTLESQHNDGYKEDDIGIMYGVGAEYFMAGPISVGASYNVYSFKEDDAENFSLNATFHFL
ncbi:Outer membrane protein beta-barrel domain-containing protein [Vibrio xiamenensis]|uniref:Outer membrane protein beta-barrel domain-containing protein n=1 Tax=Vibrio xiamenensis TaxID=861298 RepID=A0A1G7ZS73_9VIBR|nr:porin family protein [Vibrio xiamenensis]SDH11518.1 Outer membrane protein beta-barrel domain-containing protein [Vibrio xiamenensis]